MNRELPRATFKHDPDELLRVVLFCGDEKQLAKELDIPHEQITRWKRGHELVPKWFFEYLKLKQKQPEWHGFTVSSDGDSLYHPITRSRIHISEMEKLRDYRRARHLVERQAELIERLMIERDFYRKNCHAQARFGMVINRLFK